MLRVPYISQRPHNLLIRRLGALNISRLDQHRFQVEYICALVRRRLADLRAGRVPLEKLIVRLTISRELSEYRTLSPAAMALTQLLAEGKSLRPGQHVRVIYTLGKPGIRAWDLRHPPDPYTIDIAHYKKHILQAVGTILQPLKTGQKKLDGWLIDGAIPLVLSAVNAQSDWRQAFLENHSDV